MSEVPPLSESTLAVTRNSQQLSEATCKTKRLNHIGSGIKLLPNMFPKYVSVVTKINSPPTSSKQISSFSEERQEQTHNDSIVKWQGLPLAYFLYVQTALGFTFNTRYT